MKKNQLSGTELYVSPVALGTDTYGLVTDEVQSFEMLDGYVGLGGNVLDTALIYSDWEPGEKSRSEKLIGRWLKARQNRGDVIISTKGAHPQFESMDIPRLSRKEIEGDIEKSLSHLQCDYIDIYWLHRDCKSLPVGEIMETLDGLVKSGKTRYFGMSNWSHERIAEANCYAEMHGLSKIVSSQIQYSIARAIPETNDPTLVLMDDGEYEYFKQTKMPVFAFASQSKGFFAKIDKGGIESLSPKAKERFLTEENLKTYSRMKEICEKYKISVSQATIGALVYNPDFQTIPIVGCKNMAQLTDSMSGALTELTKEDVNYICRG